MSWLDILIIVVAALGAYLGWKQGLIRMAFSIVGLIIGIVLAGQWAEGFAEVLSPRGAEWAYFIAFAIILIIVLIAANIVGGILHKFMKIMMMGLVDSLGGAVLGFILGMLAIAAILSSIGLWVAGEPGGDKSTLAVAIGNSAFANLLIDNFGLILGLLPGEFDAVKELFK